MKQKLKKLKFLFATTLAGLLLFSCEDEINESYNETKNSNLVKEYTFKQVCQKPIFSKAYKDFENGVSKLKMKNKSTDSDFVIDSATVKEVTLGNQTTYTMAIQRPVRNTNYFENLIVQVKAGDSTRAYISKYTPTQNMVLHEDHNSFDFHGTIQIKEIIFDASSFQSKMSTVCYTVMTCDWGGTTHFAGENCSNISAQTYCDTFGDFGITFNYGSGGSSSSSAGSSGGPPGSPLPTPPVPPRILPDVSIEPCVKLGKLAADTNFKGRLSGLKDAAEQFTVEKLNTIYNSPTATATNNFTYQNFQGQANSPNAEYSGNTGMVGLIHSHYNGLLSIFSPTDLVDLYNLMKNPLITDDFFIGVVNSTGTAYILQISNRAKFIAFGDKHLSDEDKIKNFDKDKWFGKYHIEPTNSTADNEKGFLKLMNDVDAGVSLASETFTPNVPITPTTFANWTKKTYNANTNSVDSSNCN